MSESDKKYKILFDLAPVGISIVDSKGRVIESNDALNKILRISKEGLQKGIYKNRQYLNSAGDILLPGDFPSAIALRESRIVKDLEIRIIDENGSTFWTNVSSAPLNDGGDFAILIVQDITEEKKSELALKKSEARQRFLTENSGLGMAYYDLNGHILVFNQLAAKNMGGKASDYIGKNLTDIFGQESGEYFIERLRLASKSDRPVQFEDQVVIKGRKKWFLSTHTPVLNEGGTVEGIQVIADDITERKKNEIKIRKSQKQLQKLTSHIDEIRENERKEIAMNLHDDLGQKLTALNLNLAWMKSRIGVQSKVVTEKLESMRLILQESIEGIKEISSFLRPSMISDLGIVPAFKSLLQKFEEQSGIKSHFWYETEEFKIDNRKSIILYRILQESLTNISRHSKASIVRVTLGLLKGNIELQISDNGIGIKLHEINSLSSYGIAGIKERIRSVGGKVLIKGDKTEGTSIKVTIPLKKSKNL
jgi:PAS domain S-box-containing protein